MPTRRASGTWDGTLKEGKGSFSGESGAIEAPYSFGSRFEEAGGTNPEELIGAALAACFSMALSGNIERAGGKPDRVHTDAACTIERSGDGFRITRIHLDTRVRASGIDEDRFQETAGKTRDTCPVSMALQESVEITMDASLES
jgi:lipoyl-dependent peroxiredoxin